MSFHVFMVLYLQFDDSSLLEETTKNLILVDFSLSLKRPNPAWEKKHHKGYM